SNSKNYGGEYLEHAKSTIKEFLGPRIKKALFIPFAGVRISFDSYTSTVRSHFQEMGYELEPVHLSASPVEAVKNAEAVVVGGGNTFHLLLRMYETGLVEAIRERVKQGTPYIGWSAGSNVACPTIKTTNDMPIVE